MDPELSATAMVEMAAEFLGSVFDSLTGEKTGEECGFSADRVHAIVADERFSHFILTGTDIPMEIAMETEIVEATGDEGSAAEKAPSTAAPEVAPPTVT